MNPADRKSVRSAEKAAKVADRQEAEVIIQLCSTAAGRRWIWNRLSESHMFMTSYSPDPLQMAFAEGQRNQGLRLLDSVLLHCPEQFTLMMRESSERDRQSAGGAGAGERADSEDAGGDADRSGEYGEYELRPEPGNAYDD